eukprot:scaffold12569_cov181-Isochrysis_galbana.AAC.1
MHLVSRGSVPRDTHSAENEKKKTLETRRTAAAVVMQCPRGVAAGGMRSAISTTVQANKSPSLTATACRRVCSRLVKTAERTRVTVQASTYTKANSGGGRRPDIHLEALASSAYNPMRSVAYAAACRATSILGPARSILRRVGPATSILGPARSICRRIGPATSILGPAVSILRRVGPVTSILGPARSILRRIGPATPILGPAVSICRRAGPATSILGPARPIVCRASLLSAAHDLF